MSSRHQNIISSSGRRLFYTDDDVDLLHPRRARQRSFANRDYDNVISGDHYEFTSRDSARKERARARERWRQPNGHRGSEAGLIFVDGKAPGPPRRGPSPSHRRSRSENRGRNSQALVIRQKPHETELYIEDEPRSRDFYIEDEPRRTRELYIEDDPRRSREVIIENDPRKHQNNQLVVRPRSKSRGRREVYVEDEPSRSIDNGDVAIRARSRPGKRPSYAFVRKGKNSTKDDVDRYVVTSSNTTRTRARSDAERRPSEPIGHDGYTRRGRDSSRNRVLQVDEVDMKRYPGDSSSAHGSRPARGNYDDHASNYSGSSSVTGGGMRDSGVFVDPWTTSNRAGGHRRHSIVDTTGPVEQIPDGPISVPRGSFSAQRQPAIFPAQVPVAYAPQQMAYIPQPVSYAPQPTTYAGQPITAQPAQRPAITAPPQAPYAQGKNKGFGQYLQQGSQILNQGAGFARAGEGLVRVFQ